MKSLSRYCVSVLMNFFMFDVLQRGDGIKLFVALECFRRELSDMPNPNGYNASRLNTTLNYISLVISHSGHLLTPLGSGVDSINCNGFTVCTVYTCLHLFLACLDMFL